jgi:hypothetical protein
VSEMAPSLKPAVLSPEADWLLNAMQMWCSCVKETTQRVQKVDDTYYIEVQQLVEYLREQVNYKAPAKTCPTSLVEFLNWSGPME